MDLLLLLQLAWAYVVSLWLEAHSDEIGRGLVGAMAPWFVLFGVGVVTTLLLVAWLIAAICSRRREPAMRGVEVGQPAL